MTNSITVPVNACETATGKYVDVVNPSPEDIDVHDIAWALSRQARFAGHTLSEEIWSVAQHSVFVMRLVDMVIAGDVDMAKSLQAWLSNEQWEEYESLIYEGPGINRSLNVSLGALMHDASEAYLVDLPSPVKRHQLLREPYKGLELNMTKVINEALELPELTSLEYGIIGWGDMLALRIEAANLMPSRGKGWSGPFPDMRVVDIQLFPKVTHWKVSFKEFMAEYSRIKSKRKAVS